MTRVLGGVKVNCANGHVNPGGVVFCTICGVSLSQAVSPFTPAPPPGYTPLANPYQPAQPVPQWGVQASPYGAPAQMQNGMGTAALVLGISSLVCLGCIPGVLAIIFGAIGMGKANRGLASNGGVATTGLVLGIVGTVLWSGIGLMSLGGN